MKFLSIAIARLSGFILTEKEAPIPQLVISILYSATCHYSRRRYRRHHYHRLFLHAYFHLCLYLHLSALPMIVAN
jgi:hypothetical protein